MKNKLLLYSILFILLFALLIIVEEKQPKKIDWKESYTSYDKIPYGCYIGKKLLTDMFPNNKIYISNASVYTVKAEPYHPANFIFINNQITFDETESAHLLNMAFHGSSIFISAANIYGLLADSLKFTIDYQWDNKLNYVNFVNPNLKLNKPLHFLKTSSQSYFLSFDTLRTTVLGNCFTDDQKELVNFIKIDWGLGAFYISTFPEAFTNYALVKENASPYLSGMLSYLPNRDLYWDEYYKAGKEIIRSPLRYILSQEALKWAYYILLVSCIVFVLFKAKRTQRIIPIITPLQNSTLNFIRTIAKLYFEKQDHKNLAQKKIIYFLEHIRNSYHFKTISFSFQFYKEISEKSAISLNEIEKLFNYIQQIQQSQTITDSQLIILNQLIEQFQQKTLR